MDDPLLKLCQGGILKRDSNGSSPPWATSKSYEQQQQYLSYHQQQQYRDQYLRYQQHQQQQYASQHPQQQQQQQRTYSQNISNRASEKVSQVKKFL
jgi:hypothetical protein